MASSASRVRGLAAVGVALGLLAPGAARAGFTVAGDQLAIGFNDYGTWYDGEVGLQVRLGGQAVDLLSPGTPWQVLGIEYDQSGLDHGLYGTWFGASWGEANGRDASNATDLFASHVMVADDLVFAQSHIWYATDRVLAVHYTLSNAGWDPFKGFGLLFSIDPDPDVAAGGDYATANDALDLDGDGAIDWAESVGPLTGWTVGMGTCDVLGGGAVGHTRNLALSPASPLEDLEAEVSDDTLTFEYHAPDWIRSGEKVATAFILSVGETPEEARAQYLDIRDDLCTYCDRDGDGYTRMACGGRDCDDEDPGLHPDQDDTWYDGVDTDCDGWSDYDQDRDGYDAAEYGGDDCDDQDASIHPGAPESWTDGVDSNCDGKDGVDVDRPEPDTDDPCLDDPDCGDEFWEPTETTTGELTEARSCGCAAPAPEPGTWGLLVAAMGWVGRRRRRS